MTERASHEAIRAGDPLATPVYADWLEDGGRQQEAGWLRSGRWRLIPAGSFWIGGGGGKAGDQRVEIPQPFYLGTWPVTQGEWETVMGANPSHFSRHGGGRDCVASIRDADLNCFPVESVTLDAVWAFLDKLNRHEVAKGWMYW